MRYNSLGDSGVKVSQIGLGAMVFGWRTTREDAAGIVNAALDAGINLIDTSDSYGEGRSEDIIGEVLAGNRRRDAALLATKFRIREQAPDRSGIVLACEQSLKRLRTDRIDLYQIHYPQREVPIEEVLRATEDLIVSGKIVHSGVCNFRAWQVVESFMAADKHGLRRFVGNQVPYNLLDRSVECEVLPMSAALGHGVIAYSPLAEGILTGKYRRGENLPDNSRYAKVDKRGLHRERLTSAVHDAVEKLEGLAAKRDVPLSRYCLAWVMARPEVACTLVGPVTTEQLQDHLRSQDIALTDGDRDEIDAVTPPGGVLSPFFAIYSRTSCYAH